MAIKTKTEILERIKDIAAEKAYFTPLVKRYTAGLKSGAKELIKLKQQLKKIK